MKKLVVVLFLFSCVLLASAQSEAKDSIKISSISLSSGDGVLSQGLLFETNFTYGDDLVSLYLGERDLAVAYLASFAKGKIFVGPALEYYMNVPTLGIQVIASPIKNVSTFSWIGASAGTPGSKVELSNWQYLFFYQSATYTYKNFSASGIVMEYNGWQPIVDFKYVQPIMKKVDLFTSAGYNFFGRGHSLLRLGITYRP